MALNTLQVDPFTPFNRIHALLYSAAILALFYRHVTSLSASPVSSLVLLLSDLLLAFTWGLAQAFRFRPVRRTEHPERLLEVTEDLPGLDVFICTADPTKEPPMTVVSTVLSVMAFDYPPEKLSVYVSDDGGSEFTLLALMEAAEFARSWLPFCRENDVLLRAPEAFFESEESGGDCAKLKMMYYKMKEKVETAMAKGYVDDHLLQHHDIFKKYKTFTRPDHPTVIQVLTQSTRDSDAASAPMPNLIYLSREKRPSSLHHFKAGALNALLRVSAALTDAPYVLSLDCDMYSNDPRTPHRAFCYLLDPALSPDLAFVQFPQRFQGINRADIYNGEFKRLFLIHARGMDGLRGANFVGTGCFFARRCLSGSKHQKATTDNIASALCSESALRRAGEVAGCEYETGTKWGSLMGFRYGSLVEDYMTGYQLHCEGWRSAFCDPERPAFLGEAPRMLSDALGQCMRWTVGLLEVGLSRYCPLVYCARRASLLTGMAYAYYAFWGVSCAPVIVYALLPQLALIYGVPLFPKLLDPWFYLYVYLFVGAYGQDLVEVLRTGTKIERWWSDQRMWSFRSIAAFPFGAVQFSINRMGLSAPGFSVTSKVMEQGVNEMYEKGAYNFGAQSPFYVSLGTVAVVNLSALIVGLLKAARQERGVDEMFVQLFLSVFCVAIGWPVIEAMFVRRDAGKMPGRITNISVMVVGVIFALGYFALVN